MEKVFKISQLLKVTETLTLPNGYRSETVKTISSEKSGFQIREVQSDWITSEELNFDTPFDIFQVSIVQ